MKGPETMQSDTAAPTNGALTRLLAQFAEDDQVDPVIREAFQSASHRLVECSKGEVFLTVLVRTQGRRLEAFKDALLCLSAQTSDDFEVIIVAHDAEDRPLAQIRDMVEQLAPSFRSRVRVEDVRGGNRARPLNAGVEVARGRYVAAFDDDDLLMGNWVEAFKAAESSEPTLLRAVTAVQHLLPERWVMGEDGFRNTTWPDAAYNSEFHLFDHLVVNNSPFMSVAFPRVLFHGMGFRFDEELAVCEDWDMILRGSFALGVRNIPVITSIYRRWDGVSTSYTTHAEDEWRRSERRVIEKLNSRSQLLAPGQIVTLRQIFFPDGKLEAVINSRSWRFITRVQNALNPARHAVRRVRGTLPPPETEE